MYSRHALSAAFPSMPTSQFEELVEDIRVNGLVEPIVLFENQILDGWHRWSACQRADREAKYTVYEGNNPVEYVKSKNLHRRHLTESQRAMAVVACSEWRKLSTDYAQAHPVDNLTKLAEEADVGRDTIKRAQIAFEAGRINDVLDGKVTVKEVVNELKPKQAKESVSVSIESVDAVAKELEKLRAENKVLSERNEVLNERVEELQTMSEQLFEENQMMQKILEEDERVPALLEEVKNLQERIRIYKEHMRGLQNQANEAMRLAKKANRQNARPSE